MDFDRRNFFAKISLIAGVGLVTNPLIAFSSTSKEYTVGEVMDAFIRQIPNAPFPKTVDTLKSGTRDQVVTGILTTMFATIDIIQKAIDLKANFIIAHEPTFYNHEDETDWLKDDLVYQFKANLLAKHGIAVWRNHDYVHSLKPDAVQKAVVNQLEWSAYYKESSLLQIPSISLENLINHLKLKLAIPSLRYIGDLDQPCAKILLLPGAIGGKRQIELLMQNNPDVLICGESPEWETAEYVRNSNEMGRKLGLIMVGHAASEEAGSEFMKEWILENFPTIKVVHLASRNSLKIG